MRYPEFLKDNGRIGFIAPSFGAVIEPYHTLFGNTLKVLGDKGYKTVLGPNCYEDKGLGKSNTPEKCAEEINDFFTNDRSDVIISCGGGETMCEDLPFVDFEAIAKAKPKWYMGYSDNTNLTFTLPTLCDTAAIYGPCAGSLGMREWHESIQDAFDLLTGNKLSVHNYDKWERSSEETDDLLAGYNVTEPFAMKVFMPEGAAAGNDDSASAGKAPGNSKTSFEAMASGNDGISSAESENAVKAAFSGRLIGGCMDCLSMLCGTGFDKVGEFAERYADDGIIWFMEACELGPMSIRRVLWQLENAGWFKHVKGFIFGRPLMIDADGMGLDRFTAVTGILGKYNVPILMDVDLGHLPPMMPVISGACADVKADGNRLEISYRLE